MYPEFDGYVTFYDGFKKIIEKGPYECTCTREALMKALLYYKGKDFTKVIIRLE